VNVAGERGKMTVYRNAEKIAKLRDGCVDIEPDESLRAWVEERHLHGAPDVRAAGRGSGRSGELQVAVTVHQVGSAPRPRDARRRVVSGRRVRVLPPSQLSYAPVSTPSRRHLAGW